MGAKKSFTPAYMSGVKQKLHGSTLLTAPFSRVQQLLISSRYARYENAANWGRPSLVTAVTGGPVPVVPGGSGVVRPPSAQDAYSKRVPL